MVAGRCILGMGDLHGHFNRSGLAGARWNASIPWKDRFRGRAVETGWSDSPEDELLHHTGMIGKTELPYWIGGPCA